MGKLRVVFNMEAGYYYSKSTFIVTLIIIETCVGISYFIHSGVVMCLYKKKFGYPGIQRFPILGIRFPK